LSFAVSGSGPSKSWANRPLIITIVKDIPKWAQEKEIPEFWLILNIIMSHRPAKRKGAAAL
jgi:hypothetical protein